MTIRLQFGCLEGGTVLERVAGRSISSSLHKVHVPRSCLRPHSQKAANQKRSNSYTPHTLLFRKATRSKGRTWWRVG